MKYIIDKNRDEIKNTITILIKNLNFKDSSELLDYIKAYNEIDIIKTFSEGE